MTGMMARDFYEASPFLLLPLIALGLFVFAYGIVCTRAILLGRRGADERAQLALDDRAPDERARDSSSEASR